MKTGKVFRMGALLFIAASLNLNAQDNDPGGGGVYIPMDANDPATVASDPCIQQATSWVLGGNNITPLPPPPPPPPGGPVQAPPQNHTDIGTCNNYAFILKANNYMSTWIMPSGEVGIGTYAPSAKLTVDARQAGGTGNGLNVITNNTGYAFAVHNSSGGIHAIWNDGRVAVGNTNCPDAAQLNVNVNYNNPYFDNAIDVFNTTSGQTEFRVKNDGHAFAREINVQMSAYPDYVFNKDYSLMPLSELESYIAAHKHLPNVPSAIEIGKNGAELGELSRVQMEKIEELTLYMLQLKNEMDALKKENAELKREIKARR